MTKKWKVLLAGIALVAASCSSDGNEAVATAETTTTTTTTEAPVDTEVAGETLEPEVEDRPEAFGEPCANPDLPALEQMVVTAASGLRARTFPVDGEIIDVLPTGTVVDTSSDAISCGVLEDGVWLEIGTPLLATGGWVSMDFLEPAAE